MRSLAELRERLGRYDRAEYLYYPNLGYIAWHYSTGENIECLFLEAVPGCGTLLYGRMASLLVSRNERPYNSTFAFCLGSNERARSFYRKLEFVQVDLGRSIYRDDDTVLNWIEWRHLLEVLQRFRVLDE